MASLTLRFEKGEQAPQAGETVIMQGLAGKYAVTIHHILANRSHPDGATLLDVRATRHLISDKSKSAGFHVGDTVRVIGPQCKGLVGELKVIDEHNDEAGDFFGVRFDGVAGYIFFRADEMKRVENVDRAELPF